MQKREQTRAHAMATLRLQLLKKTNPSSAYTSPFEFPVACHPMGIPPATHRGVHVPSRSWMTATGSPFVVSPVRFHFNPFPVQVGPGGRCMGLGVDWFRQWHAAAKVEKVDRPHSPRYGRNSMPGMQEMVGAAAGSVTGNISGPMVLPVWVWSPL